MWGGGLPEQTRTRDVSIPSSVSHSHLASRPLSFLKTAEREQSALERFNVNPTVSVHRFLFYHHAFRFFFSLSKEKAECYRHERQEASSADDNVNFSCPLERNNPRLSKAAALTPLVPRPFAGVVSPATDRGEHKVFR